jgi:hypothetical protein
MTPCAGPTARPSGTTATRTTDGSASRRAGPAPCT